MKKLLILIVFITLLGLINNLLGFIPPFYYVNQGYYHFHANVSDQAYHLRFIIALILPLLLTLLFTRTLTFINKDRNTEYLFGKIFRRYWWWVLPIFFALLIISYFFDTSFEPHPGLTLFVVVLGLPLAFILVMIFSILLPYLYLKIINKKIIFWPSIAILLFVCATLIYKSVPTFVCSDDDYSCLAQKYNELSYCEKFEAQANKNMCYVLFSIRSTDIKVCDKIIRQDSYNNGVLVSNDFSVYNCIVNVAMNTSDIKLCDLVPEDYKFYQRFYQIKNTELRRGDYTDCRSSL
ncbi:MAG: hypothetical protein AAB453_02550 [Patescibacteria group bacterium]